MKPAKTVTLPQHQTIEMDQCKYEVVVDDELRNKSTTLV